MYNICKNLELILYKSRAQTRLHGQIITAIIYQTKSAWTTHDANESTGQNGAGRNCHFAQGENIKIFRILKHQKTWNENKKSYKGGIQSNGTEDRSYNQSVKIINLWFFIVKDCLSMLCTTSVDRYVVLAYELYTYIYETSDNIH